MKQFVWVIGVAIYFSLICFASGAHATVISPTAIGTAVDDSRFICCGADGTFDAITSDIAVLGGSADIASNQDIKRGLIEFNLAVIPADSVITGAVLTIEIGSTLNRGFPIAVHGYAGNGIIELSDAIIDNFIVEATVPREAGPPIDIDVLSFVETFPSFAGFMLRTLSENVLSSEANGAEIRNPTLSVSFREPEPDVGNGLLVSEPSPLALLGIGLVGLGYIRRHLR